MRLKEFLALQGVEEAGGDLNCEISGLTYDSRQVAAGHVFFAVPGEKVDGHDFIDEAVRRGAVAVVATRKGVCPSGIAWVQVKDVRATMGWWSAHFFGYPSHRLKLVGVTGTNGKTTVTYLIESILAAAGMEPGVIGTINYRYQGNEAPSHHTTPESLDLQALLAEMANKGVQSVAMEVSSHALAQERVRGLEFDVAVFTNLSRDHLDYHGDMENYFLAKRKLFADLLRNSNKKKRSAVICGEDEHGRKLLRELRHLDLDVWSYGERDPWDIHPLDIKSDVTGLRGKMQVKGDALDFSSSLLGSANLQNILGAVGAGFALGLSAEAVAKGIRQMTAVPGRLDRVENPLDIAILIDYAHTPDALEKVLGAVRPLTQGRVITVFGCGGDRDRGKRPLMGAIAARLSDCVVLTSDNPRTEDPVAILHEIEKGMQRTDLKPFSFSELELQGTNLKSVIRNPKFDKGYWIEADRREAIRMALRWARAGDLVLIAGKGHEDYQILGSRRIHFDDREVAREEASRI